jgi:bisphosphoglycerate-independent phosphoglycerate mutase (AlkP superfamily)
MIFHGWENRQTQKFTGYRQMPNVPFINSLYDNFPEVQLRTAGLNVGHQKDKWVILKLVT